MHKEIEVNKSVCSSLTSWKHSYHKPFFLFHICQEEVFKGSRTKQISLKSHQNVIYLIIRNCYLLEIYLNFFFLGFSFQRPQIICMCKRWDLEGFIKWNSHALLKKTLDFVSSENRIQALIKNWRKYISFQ